jgi:predicted hotdog family 3-hydroxylacyl-ACP dehydratase
MAVAHGYGERALNDEIERLIPHREGMKLLDAIITADGRQATTESVVTDRWPLVENRRASPLVLIELVAQTSAVCIGWKEAQEAGDEPIEGKGWLVGIKSADFFTGSISVGTRIRTQTEIRFSIDNYTEIRGKSMADRSCLGEMVLQVMRDNEG